MAAESFRVPPTLYSLLYGRGGGGGGGEFEQIIMKLHVSIKDNTN